MSSIGVARWQVLSPFFDEVIELEGNARAAWLAAFRTKHPDLAPDLDIVLNELAALDEKGFLADDPSRLLGETSLAGQTLGVYTIESVIGRGGMGSVWRARRNDGHFEGKVAIKLLNLALTGASGEERFRREGRVLAKLTHPNIARILDAGIMATGQLYLVLEYVEGGDIDRYCDERKLDIEARIKLFLDVLAAVGHAHANLIVHRDIKPSNIYVTNDGLVKLLDFGVAKLLEPDDPSQAPAHLTQDATRALTPRYAAPEQLLGEPITIGTDVYALGVLLYVLLSGQYPTGKPGTSTLAQMHSLLQTEPAKLSDAATVARTCDPETLENNATQRAATPLKLKRALQGDLDNIVAKALKKNPQERYASVKEFADDLRRYLRNEPVLARADSTWYRVRKFVARNRFAVGLSAAALIAVLTIATVALYEAYSLAAERDRTLTLSSRNEAVANFLNVLITEAATSDKPVTMSDLLARSEALARAEYRNSPEHRAAVLGMLANYYSTNEKSARAESLLREALDTVKASPDADLRRKLTCDHASSLQGVGKVPESIRILNEVINEPDITPARAAECLEYLAFAGLFTNDAASALKFGNLALARLRQVERPSPGLEPVFLGTIAYAEFLNGRNDLAGQWYERALAQFELAGRARGPDVLAIRSNWAMAIDGSGNPRRAFELNDEILRITVQNDPSAPPPPTLLFNRARGLEYIGRFPLAHEGYLNCLAQAERTETPEYKVLCLLGLVSVSREIGEIAASDRYLAEAVQILATSVPVAFPEHTKMKYERGMLALGRGQIQDARTDMNAVIADTKSRYLKMDALRARTEINLHEGQLVAAEADARQSLALAQAAQGSTPHSNRTGLAWLSLGSVLVSKGDAAAAHNAFQTAVEHLSNTVDADHPMLVRARRLAD